MSHCMTRLQYLSVSVHTLSSMDILYLNQASRNLPDDISELNDYVWTIEYKGHSMQQIY